MEGRVMRSGFVLTMLAAAVALGFIAGTAESRLLTRVLIIGFVPAIWAASHLVERLADRDIWHFTGPYPYRWMRDEGGTAVTRSRVGPQSNDEALGARDPDERPLAA